MAPMLLPLIARSKTTTHYNSSRGGGGAGIGGGVVAAIVAVVIIIFICVFIYEYRKASKLRALNGTPIRYSNILKKAALISLTFGLATCCCAACFADDNVPTGNGGGDGGQQMFNGGGFVQQQPMMPAQDYQQPQMNWQPVQGAAQDGVQ